MKIFANKSIWRKLVIAFLIINFFTFALSKPVEASLGGQLMEPVCDLLVAIGDFAVHIMHKIIIKQDVNLVHINFSSNAADIFWDALKWVGIIAILVATCILLVWAPEAAAGLITLKGAIGGIIAAGVADAVSIAVLAGGIWVGVSVYNVDFWRTDDRYIPMYSLSPEAIFKGEIGFFNVNFFDESDGGSVNTVVYGIPEIDDREHPTVYSDVCNSREEVESNMNSRLRRHYGDLTIAEIRRHIIAPISNEPPINNSDGSTTTKVKIYSVPRDGEFGTLLLEMIMTSTTETEGTAGTNTSYTYEYRLYSTTEVIQDSTGSISSELRNVIAGWYRRLLIFAIVGMMSVLVYIGIRILLTSTSQQKAKYKQLLGDWFVGIILLFTMHYIMVFSNMFVGRLRRALSEVSGPVYISVVEDENDKIKHALGPEGLGFNIVEVPIEGDEVGDRNEGDMIEYINGDKKYFEIPTTLMGKLRYDLQDKDDLNYGGYTILFLVAVIYLIIYSVMYMRRVIYMAFLTMIAPLVALTYPIDKANDGKAQGFDTWFKEYIFNLLLQPLHLILYTILIASAAKLAEQNMIYAIFAMGFMVPAEKLLRTMFNFQKANTPGLFGGAAGGALVLSGMKWLMGHGPKGGDGKGKDGNSSGIKADESGKIYSVSGKETIDINEGNNDKTNILAEGSDSKSAINTFDLSNDKENNPTINVFSPNRTGEQNDYSNKDMEDNPLENVIGITNERFNRRSNEDLRNEAKILEKNISEQENGWTTDKENLDAINAELAARYKADNPKTGTYQDESNIPPKKTESNHKRSIIRGLKNAASAYSDGIENKFRRRVNNAKPIRTMTRLAGRAFGGATLGMIGLAAGVATGEASKTAQYAGIGIAGGAKLGRETADVLRSAISVDGASEQFQRGYYGEKEYQKRMALKNQEIAKRNEEYIRKVQEKLSLDRIQAKERLEEMIPFYYDNKITDINEMLKMEKVVKKDNYVKKMEDVVTQNANVRKSNKEKLRDIDNVKEARKNARKKALIGHHLEEQYSISKNIGKREDIEKSMNTDYGWSPSQIREYMGYADTYNRATKNM